MPEVMTNPGNIFSQSGLISWDTLSARPHQQHVLAPLLIDEVVICVNKTLLIEVNEADQLHLDADILNFHQDRVFSTRWSSFTFCSSCATRHTTPITGSVEKDQLNGRQWDHLKSLVFKTHTTGIQDLKGRITAECRHLPEQLLGSWRGPARPGKTRSFRINLPEFASRAGAPYSGRLRFYHRAQNINREATRIQPTLWAVKPCSPTPLVGNSP
ncbi:hypothetical protein J6590_099567 [Homalodisca vitripennis]|nr:hypothetical protein J6590_099567 [Homalodisca vitripennis]